MFREIEINARQEAARMRHHYVGVEHYFIGLLELSDGLLARLLDLHGVTPDYVRDTLRRYIGRGARKRQRHIGMPATPRAGVMLNLAYELARDARRDEPNERDVLLAILEEGDNIPVRILWRLNISPHDLARAANADASGSFRRPSILKFDFSPHFNSAAGLSDEHVFILRRLFEGYAVLRIERQLTGGYSGAVVLLVTPLHADGAQDASVVVKIGDAASILEEERRYNRYVRNTLPPLTARLEDKTTAELFDSAGLKYTFVPDPNGGADSMRILAHEMGAAQLGTWLKEKLFPYFGKNWWMQRRPQRFQVWEEYDWLLPPLLTLDYVAEEEAKAAKAVALIVDRQIKRGRAEGVAYGALVGVHHFVVGRIYREKRAMQLSLGLNTSETIYRAYPILVRNVDIAGGAYFHTEMIERQYGRIWKTRRDVFFETLSQLAADFDPRGSDIPFMGTHVLPNPILTYDTLLDRQIDGSLSRIHGDLHLGNILRGTQDLPFLIDFSHARSGHTAFDWVSLEISILAELVAPLVQGDWASVRQIAPYLLALYRGEPLPNDPIGEALQPVIAVREIAAQCLNDPADWTEYYIALALAALRALTWNTMGDPARRLMLLVSALAQWMLRTDNDVESTPLESTARDFDTGFSKPP
jgi:hypothetical protein